MTRLSTLSIIALTAVLLLSVAGAAAAVGPINHGASADTSLQQNEPPTATFQHSPENPEPGEAVTLNATASNDPDGEIAEYQWDLDGDGTTDTTGGPNARVAFPGAGAYEVTLTVVDNDGATDSVTNEIIVAGDINPNARFNATPTQVAVGEGVTLNATASNDPDGQIEMWEFDTNGNGTYDRSFTSPPILTINYAEPGTYDVTLRVTDNDGLTDTTTVQVTVESSATTATTGDGVQTTVQTRTVTTTPITDVGGDGSGGGSITDAIPGGGLTVGALVVLILLIIGAGVVYSGGGGGRGGRRQRRGGSDRRPVIGFIVALLVTLILIAAPVAYLRGQIGTATAAETDVALAFIELAALFLPALMLLLFVWFRFPDQLAQRGGGGVGPLSGAGFRLLGFALGFVAVVLVVIGLAGLLLAIDLPTTIAVAGAFVLGGIGITALALALAVVYLAIG